MFKYVKWRASDMLLIPAYIAMILNKYMTYGFPRIGEENAWLFARWRNRFAGYECVSNRRVEECFLVDLVHV